MRRLRLLVAFLLLIACLAHAAENSIHFAVIGDFGCGCPAQEAVADKMLQWYQKKPFELVLTTGDNIYGDSYNRFWNRRRGGDKKLFDEKFDRYYNPFRNRGIPFFATLGNHDLETRSGKDLIEDRRRFNILSSTGYYYFSPNPDLVTFVALNSESLLYSQNAKAEQLIWLQKVLSESKSIWKIVYGHHPLYSAPGSHASDLSLRKMLEPLMVRNGVQVYIAGHNHFYARMKPQFGIVHFTTGGGGRDLKTPRETPETEVIGKAHHFMHFDIYEDRLDYWAVALKGPVLDEGSIRIGAR